jgi:hypothetical protein
MPARYVILFDRRLVVSIGWGRLTFADFRSQQDEFKNDPAFDPTFDQLVDVSQVEHLELTTEQAKIIAARGIFQANSRRAVIAKDPTIFGTARMMDAYHSVATGRNHVRVFYDRDAALKWLGLDSLPEV